MLPLLLLRLQVGARSIAWLSPTAIHPAEVHDRVVVDTGATTRQWILHRPVPLTRLAADARTVDARPATAGRIRH